MTTFFQPKGEKSRRVMLTELVHATNYGEVLDYAGLSALLGCESRREIHSAVNSARLSLERDTKKALLAVDNKGYRVVHPGEQGELAVKHQRKARNQVRRAKSKVDHIDMTALTPEQRQFVTTAQIVLAAQADFERRADVRYAKASDVRNFMAESSKRVDRSEAEISRLQERLDRLESGMK